MTALATVIGRGATGDKPAAGDVPVGSLYYDTTLGQWERSTGAAWEVCEPTAASDYTVWDPDAPPTAPSAYDDEFDNASLAVKWTEFDPTAITTPTEGEVGLYLDQATHAGEVLNGIHQAIPAGDFTIWAKLAHSSIMANSPRVGLCLWDDATNVAAGLVAYYAQNLAAVETASVHRWTNYTTYNSQYGGRQIAGQTGIYLRIRRTGTTYSFDISSDGIGYEQIFSGAIAFVPDQFGIIIDNGNTGANLRGFYHFFRYTNSDVGITGIMSGDRVNAWRA